MSDQTNIFSQESAPVTPEAAPVVPAQPDASDVTTMLSGIKNELGQQKYDSLPKALEGLAHAQSYIPQLKTELQQKEQELATLRAELEKRAAVEDVVTRLTAQQQREPEGVRQPPTPSGLDEQAVVELVQRKLMEQRTMESAAQNTAQVQQALVSQYGDKAAEVIKLKAAELGTTPEQLGQLASQNPKMVLALFNTSGASSPKPTTGGVVIPASYKPAVPEVPVPTKSLLSGATSKDQAEYMRQVRESVYARHGIQ